MPNQISWHVILAVKPGRLDDLKALTAEMVEVTRGEAGVLSYQRFIADDNRFVHVYERYLDCDAAVIHLRTFRQRFAERFSTLVDRKSFVVFGTPSEALKVILDTFGAIYLRPLGDLRYWA